MGSHENGNIYLIQQRKLKSDEIVQKVGDSSFLKDFTIYPRTNQLDFIQMILCFLKQ